MGEAGVVEDGKRPHVVDPELEAETSEVRRFVAIVDSPSRTVVPALLS